MFSIHPHELCEDLFTNKPFTHPHSRTEIFYHKIHPDKQGLFLIIDVSSGLVADTDRIYEYWFKILHFKKILL